jgi:hypothetical protein
LEEFMRAVTTTTPIARVAQRLRTAALAAALACAANGAYASFASVIINGLFFSETAAPGSFIFAPTDTQNQAWDLQALTNNVLDQQNAGSVTDWANLDKTAQSAQANATLSSSVDTDPSTQVESPRFTLSATANSPGANGVLYSALGNMITDGSFCFWDENTDFDGTSASCTGSGSLAFTVFYDLIVNAASPNSAYAEIDVLGTGVPDGFYFDLASTGLGIPSKTDQSFSWTADLIAGDAALFTIAGSVVAEAVPEPGILSLAALGLIGLAATRRRHARTVS